MGDGIKRARAAAKSIRRGAGTCPVCRRVLTTRTDGMLMPHGPRNKRCAGSGGFPAGAKRKDGGT
jgi:hypothetical protein